MGYNYALDPIFIFFLPAPAAVTVTAPPGVIAGSSISLTCTVELSQDVDPPVTVNIQWIGPVDVMIMPVNPVAAVMVNNTYISTVSVGAARAGNYTCLATITSDGTASGSTDITVGMYVPYCIPIPKRMNNNALNHYSPAPSPQ